MVLAVAIGCGSGEPSEDAYRDEVNALCAEAEKQSESLPQPGSPAGLESLVGKSAELAREYHRRLAIVDPPAELEDRHRESLRLSRQGVRLLEDLEEELSVGGRQRKTFELFLPDVVRITEESNRLAREMGLDDCVEPLPFGGAAPA
jgi:hypothetical protein